MHNKYGKSCTGRKHNVDLWMRRGEVHPAGLGLEWVRGVDWMLWSDVGCEGRERFGGLPQSLSTSQQVRRHRAKTNDPIITKRRILNEIRKHNGNIVGIVPGSCTRGTE